MLKLPNLCSSTPFGFHLINENLFQKKIFDVVAGFLHPFLFKGKCRNWSAEIFCSRREFAIVSAARFLMIFDVPFFGKLNKLVPAIRGFLFIKIQILENFMLNPKTWGKRSVSKLLKKFERLYPPFASWNFIILYTPSVFSSLQLKSSVASLKGLLPLPCLNFIFERTNL